MEAIQLMKSHSITLVVFLALVSGLAAFPNVCSASILKELRESIQLFEKGELQHLSLSKHKVIGTRVLAVRGPKERRQVRFARWQLSLSGDQRSIFKSHGFPSYRYR